MHAPDVAFILATHVSVRLHGMTLALLLYAIRRYHPSAVVIIVDNGSPVPITYDALPFRERVHIERNSPQQTMRREYGAYATGLLVLNHLPGGIAQWSQVVFMQAALVLGQPVPALADGCAIQPLSSLAAHPSAPFFQTGWFMKRRTALESFLNASGLEPGDLRKERAPFLLHNSFVATREGARLILNASGSSGAVGVGGEGEDAAPLLSVLPLRGVNLGDKQNGEKFGGVFVDRVAKKVAALDAIHRRRQPRHGSSGASCVTNVDWRPVRGGWKDATWLPGSTSAHSADDEHVQTPSRRSAARADDQHVQTGPQVGFWKVHGSGVEGHPVGLLALMRLADTDEDGLLTRSELVAVVAGAGGAAAGVAAGTGAGGGEATAAPGSGAGASGAHHAAWPALWRATCLTLPYQRDRAARRDVEGLRQPAPSHVVRCLAAALERRDGGHECAWPPGSASASASAAQSGCASCDSEASSRWWARQALATMAALPTSLLSQPPQPWVDALYGAGGLTQPVASGERYWGSAGGGWPTAQQQRQRDKTKAVASSRSAKAASAGSTPGAEQQPKPEPEPRRRQRRQFAADFAAAVLLLADDDGDGIVSFNDLARMTEAADEPSAKSFSSSSAAKAVGSPISSTLLPLCWRAEAAGLLSLDVVGGGGKGTSSRRGSSSRGVGPAVATVNASAATPMPDAARDYRQRLWQLQHPPQPIVSWDEPNLARGSLSVALNTAALVMARRALCCLQRQLS